MPKNVVPNIRVELTRGHLHRFLSSTLVVLPCHSRSAIKPRTFSHIFDLPWREKKLTSAKQYCNPIVLAQAWQHRIDSGESASGADLADKLGVTRAHVTQVLRLLTMAPEVKAKVLALGDPMQNKRPGVHTLLGVCKLSEKEQISKLEEILRSVRPK